MREAIRALGVSRQTVLQRVKRGELEAVHIVRGKQKGLRIKVLDRQPRDCRKIGGQAAIVAIGGYGSLAGWNFCPKAEPSVPL